MVTLVKAFKVGALSLIPLVGETGVVWANEIDTIAKEKTSALKILICHPHLLLFKTFQKKACLSYEVDI